MKKKAALIMALALAASILTGCGGGDNGSSEKNNSSASAGKNTSDSAGKNSADDSAGDSAESGQNPAEEVQVGDCTLIKAEGMDAEVQSASLVGYCAQTDTYYAAPNYSGGNSFEQGIMILNSDFSVKEKIDGVISAYPIYGIIHYMDNNGNYFLRIKDKEYSVDYGKVFMSDGVVIYNQTYYSFNGDKLDLPYHGEFYDGKCIFYEKKDDTYYCMDLKGNITDITEKVKPVTDNGSSIIIASIEDKYYVDYYGQWFYTDGTLVEKTSAMCYGTPARGSDGKYSNGSMVKTRVESSYSEAVKVNEYVYFYIDLANDEEPIAADATHYRYDWGGPYLLSSAGSYWVGEFPIAYGISEFHNGIALMLDMDYNLYFVNSSYEQISDTLFTITGDDRNDEYGKVINNAYIGGGKFTFKANGETYLISAGGSDYYDNNAPKASDTAQEEPAPETESAPVESEQTPDKDTKPQNNFPQSVKYNVTKTPFSAYFTEENETSYSIEGYSAEYDIYYAVYYYMDDNQLFKSECQILNSDFSVKETFDDVKSWYPLYDTIYYKDKDGNRILRIKDKEYAVEKGKVTISDGVIIQNETYYSMDGDKLDLPYHGEFYDGKCFYTEGGKTFCMDMNGNVTDYTEKVKPITDAGYDVAALIDDKYYVTSNNHWFSIDGTDLKVNGMPYKGSDGKYINGNLAKTGSEGSDGKVILYNIIDLASSENLYSYSHKAMRYEWGADSIWIRENGNWYNSEDKTQNAYALSEFYNGVALTLDKDLNIYLVNYNYDKISDTLATLPEGEEGNAKTFDDAYIGGGRFTFKANNAVYVVTVDG